MMTCLTLNSVHTSNPSGNAARFVLPDLVVLRIFRLFSSMGTGLKRTRSWNTTATLGSCFLSASSVTLLLCSPLARQRKRKKKTIYETIYEYYHIHKLELAMSSVVDVILYCYYYYVSLLLLLLLLPLIIINLCVLGQCWQLEAN